MTRSHSTSNSGIYIIQNTQNNKIYIGQAQNIQQRWQYHRRSLRGGYHANAHLQRVWSKYGEKIFKFLILEYCPVEQLNEREQHYLDIYMPKGACYNISVDAASPMRGRSISEETRQKMSEANRGRKKPPRSPEHQAKISAANKGREVSAETRQKLSEAGKRRPPASDETRAKLSKSLKGRPAPNRGKPTTEETKQKISEAAKQRWAKQREESSHSGSE